MADSSSASPLAASNLFISYLSIDSCQHLTLEIIYIQGVLQDVLQDPFLVPKSPGSRS